MTRLFTPLDARPILLGCDLARKDSGVLKFISIHYFLGFCYLELALLLATTSVVEAKASAHADHSARAKIAVANHLTNASTELGEVLELNQTHRLLGKLNVTIARNAVCIASRDKNFKYICKAPSWDVVAFNTESKIKYVYPFSNWQKNGIRTALSIESNEGYLYLPLIFQKRENYAGLIAHVYMMPSEDQQLSPGPKFGEYWVLRRPGDIRIKRFIQSLYDLPQFDGIPLRYSRAYGGHKWGFGLQYNTEKQQVSNWLTTTNSRLVKLNPAVFVVPEGYKAASDSEVLMRSKDVEDTFGQILD